MSDQNLNNMSVTWNSGGTTFAATKMNVTDTASAAGSLLLQFQVGGSDKFTVRKDGKITGAGDLAIAGSATITGNLTVSGTLSASGITGAVTGPASSTDNAIARFNGTSGGVLQNSGVIIDDSNNLTGAVNITVSGSFVSSLYFLTTTAAVVLGPTAGAGAVYLRPNGGASAVGQVSVASTGAVTINGTLTVTG